MAQKSNKRLFVRTITFFVTIVIALQDFKNKSPIGVRRRQVQVQVQSSNDGDGIRAGSLDDVVTYLTKLAEKKPGELWSAFGMDDDR
jgi:hypothetical protein